MIRTYAQEKRKGSRAHYVKPSITMSPVLLRRIKQLGAILQERGEKDTDVSSLMREACERFLVEMEKYLGISK
jgi:hypothetical protein